MFLVEDILPELERVPKDSGIFMSEVIDVATFKPWRLRRLAFLPDEELVAPALDPVRPALG